MANIFRRTGCVLQKFNVKNFTDSNGKKKLIRLMGPLLKRLIKCSSGEEVSNIV